MEILQYIRSLLPSGKSTRKRSSTDDIEIPMSAKHRKVCVPSIPNPEEDWRSTSTSHSINRTRRSFMESFDTILKPTAIKSTIVIDDDDLENKKSNCNKTMKLTSTPNVSKTKENGFDDLSFVKFKDPIRKNNPGRTKIEPHPTYFNNIKFKSCKTFAGTKDTTPRFPLTGMKKPSFASSADYVFRLDEKRKYEELINKTFSLEDSYGQYFTPVGKIQPQSRTQKILSLAASNLKPLEVFDLTNGDGRAEKSLKMSTKDTIMKVLDGMDNEVIAIKDSDSDVEILPSPPSPKPDFKVERINSLKTNVHPSEPQHVDWITNKIKKHAEEIAKREKEIEQRKARLNQIREINEEVRTKQLEEQVKKCLHIKEILLPIDIKEKLPELTKSQEQAIAMALDKNQSLGAVLASKFSLHISRRDMLTLANLNWLNDEVINFYMNLIIERGKADKYPSVYAFNTFFYPKLLKDGHSSIRRWTRKIDIFSYDMICVPIHMSMHWCMAVIDLRKKFIGYYDSMGKPNHQCTDALLRYLQEEHLDKKKCEIDVSDWKLKCLKDIPQQMNGSDCGMFSCTYAEFLSRDASFTFSQEDMPYLRKKMVIEILEGKLLLN